MPQLTLRIKPEDMLRTFAPMPGGKPDEKLWGEVVASARETARATAAQHGRELLVPWHQSSEWTEEVIGGETMQGWTFHWATREIPNGVS